ncbi:MAG: DUF4124 domain-containing protein [Woeseiaceae bacterium]
MNRKLLVFLVTAAAVITGASVSAGEIYKYVDENGNIHYLDRPTGESGEERLGLTYAQTDNATVSAQQKQRQEYMAKLDEAREESATRREAEEMARAEMEQRDARCQQHRARLEGYLQARHLYRENEAGERVYLDESQTLEARQKVEELIQKDCS